MRRTGFEYKLHIARECKARAQSLGYGAQVLLSKITGIHQYRVSNWLNEKSPIHPDDMILIVHALGGRYDLAADRVLWGVSVHPELQAKHAAAALHRREMRRDECLRRHHRKS